MMHVLKRWWSRWVTPRPAGASPELPSPSQDIQATKPRLPGDPDLLERSRTQWQFGDWTSLAQLTQDAVESHPDRAKLAMLAASGHQQTGDYRAARAWATLAHAWGCDRRQLARLMVGGVYNTLARAASAAGHEARALAHFQQAVVGTGGDERLLVQARSVRELGRLGLLNDAAQRIRKQLTDLTAASSTRALSMGDPRLSVLNTQIELLQHEIQLAQKRSVPTAKSVVESSSASPRVVFELKGNASPIDLEALRAKSTSQLGQDLWVLERTNYKRNGFFVEFGATDGVRLSNTFLLETMFGWQGICAEPNPRMFEQLRDNRRCQTTQACIGAASGEIVDFIFADEYGGMVRDMAKDMHASKRAAFAALPEFIARIETTSLHDLLISMGAPHDIDYLSIDTEGSELAILQAFPFERWQIRCLTVEHNFNTADRSAIHALLTQQGYKRIEAQWDDWYYLGD